MPTPLRNLTANAAEVQVEAASVNALIAALEAKHPGLKERLCDDGGKLRRFVNVYLNEEDIRFLKAEATELKDGDEVSIVPAIAGGR
ncbi:MAG TPA: MoaD/ThiS family protein [bacterium]|nr:MoaD/ThiS family protein [bacterium]